MAPGGVYEVLIYPSYNNLRAKLETNSKVEKVFVSFPALQYS